MRRRLRLAVAACLVACSSSGSAPRDGGDSPDAAGSPDTGAEVGPRVDGGSDAHVAPDAAQVTDAGADATAAADSAPEATEATYLNPVIAADYPDPFVLRVDHSYFAFATNSAGRNVQAATSTDRVTWTQLTDALPVLPAWAAANQSLTWAPTVLPRPGGYVLYYTARDTASGYQCISRALATSPQGPYVDTSSAPLVCQTSICGSIDPSPFVDDDGSATLVWKSDENNPVCNTPPRLWSQPLTADGVSVIGSASELLQRDQLWEGPVIEGPAMWKSDGVYYLFYSANRYDSADYAVGYGVCSGPSGPCQKMTLDQADGGVPAILQSAGSALGPGGEQVFDDADGGLWVVYHAWTAPLTSYSGGGARSMRIDRLGFDAGRPYVAGPTTTPQPL